MNRAIFDSSKKENLLMVHKPQPYGHWQVNGTRLGLRFSAKTVVISQKNCQKFYVVLHIEGFIGLLFASRIEVTMP